MEAAKVPEDKTVWDYLHKHFRTALQVILLAQRHSMRQHTGFTICDGMTYPMISILSIGKALGGKQ